MTVRVGINGFGRIGRAYLRRVLEAAATGTGTPLEVVAINDLAAPGQLAHLLRHDSLFGRLDRDITVGDGVMLVDGAPVAVIREQDPATLPWREHGVDLVVECTGRFRTRDQAARHLKAGARKVLLSVPGKDVDTTVVMGVNEADYDPELHDVVSNASCTTNCVAPMAKVLSERFGIARGLMTTVHGYTNDQVVLDGPHKDPRRGRSAAVNIIPTSTGAARAVGLVLPSLAGALDGTALRVPVEDGSIADLTVLLHRPVTADEVNDAFREAADGPLHGILRVSDDPIVSRDIIGDSASCVLDAPLTQASAALVKVFGWYDNEWGYTNRLVDLSEYIAGRLT